MPPAPRPARSRRSHSPASLSAGVWCTPHPAIPISYQVTTRGNMRKILLLFAGLFALLLSGSAPTEPIRPGNPEWPVAWISYRRVDTTETDFADLKAHGVGLVETGTGNVERAKEQLAVARRFHMKYAISLPEITESAGLVRQQGLTDRKSTR